MEKEFSKAAVERAMKVQEVILRAMSGQLFWSQAASIIGVSDRTMRRWRERYECSLYSDRASHFFQTPKAVDVVDRQELTQVGRALAQLGIEMIPAYSPQAGAAAREAARRGRDGSHRNCGFAG